MYHLVEGKTIDDLAVYGFRDAGDCYEWSIVRESGTGDLVGQTLIKIAKDNGLLTFIGYGRWEAQIVEQKLKDMYNGGVIAQWNWNGEVEIPDFSVEEK